MNLTGKLFPNLLTPALSTFELLIEVWLPQHYFPDPFLVFTNLQYTIKQEKYHFQ